MEAPSDGVSAPSPTASSTVAEYIIVNIDNETYSLCEDGNPTCDVLTLEEVKEYGSFITFRFGGSSFLKMAKMDVISPFLKK